jgi:hypothetical protein
LRPFPLFVRAGNWIGAAFFVGLTLAVFAVWRVLTNDSELGYRIHNELSKMPARGDISLFIREFVPVGMDRRAFEELMRRSSFQCHGPSGRPETSNRLCTRVFGSFVCSDHITVEVQIAQDAVTGMNASRHIACL